MAEAQDTEIVLGTGKLLGIFFALIAVCGTFFGLGYTLGRNSGPMTLQNAQPSATSNSSGAKPQAGVTVTAATPAPDADSNAAPVDVNQAANSQVEQTPPPATQTADSDSSTANDNPVAAPKTPVAAVKAMAPPELKTASTSTTTGTFTVQVAAVTKQDDAQALVAALRKKNYPVFVAPNPAGDNLYHVQIGPFAEMRDAEAMKSKLAGDGYNAIVKK